MKNGKVGYVDAVTFDKDGDLKLKGKKKIKTEDGKVVYEDIDSENEQQVYPK